MGIAVLIMENQYTYGASGSITDTAQALVPWLSNDLGICITV